MVILAICFLLFIDAMSIGLVFPVFAPLFMSAHSGLFAAGTDEQIRAFLYASIISVPMLCMMFGGPMLGMLSDRWGRKKVLLLGLVGIMIGCAMSVAGIFLLSIVLLFLSRMLIGFVDGCEAVGQAAIADISKPEDKAKNMGYVTLSATLGFIIGPILGGVFSDKTLSSLFSDHTPFVLAMLLTAINFIMLKRFFKETYVPKNQVKRSYASMLKHAFKLIVDRRVRALSLVFFTMEICWGGFFESTSLVLAHKFHYSGAMIGFFMSFIGVAFCLGVLFMIKIMLRFFQQTTIVTTGLTLMTLVMIGMSIFSQHIEALWWAVVPICLGVAMTYNNLMSMFSNAVSKDEQGWVMGSTTAIMAIAWFLAAVLIGITSEHTALLYSCFTLFALITLGLYVWHNHKTRGKIICGRICES